DASNLDNRLLHQNHPPEWAAVVVMSLVPVALVYSYTNSYERSATNTREGTGQGRGGATSTLDLHF
ncbi:Hypothetical predicted protein, partial [Olea europaea subsp. europaea]